MKFHNFIYVFLKFKLNLVFFCGVISELKRKGNKKNLERVHPKIRRKFSNLLPQIQKESPPISLCKRFLGQMEGVDRLTINPWLPLISKSLNKESKPVKPTKNNYVCQK